MAGSLDGIPGNFTQLEQNSIDKRGISLNDLVDESGCALWVPMLCRFRSNLRSDRRMITFSESHFFDVTFYFSHWILSITYPPAFNYRTWLLRGVSRMPGRFNTFRPKTCTLHFEVHYY